MYLFISLSVLECIRMPRDHVSVDKTLPLSLHKLLDENFESQQSITTLLSFISFLKASAEVFYWILDINDHLPHFPSQYYNVTVGEVGNAMFSVIIHTCM